MGISFYLVAEQEIEGFDDFIDDKSLAQLSDLEWTTLFEQLNIPSFFEFISADFEALNDETLDLPADVMQTPWFEASEGLHVFQTLKQHFEATPNIAPAPTQAGIVTSLGDFIDILQTYQQHQVRFHLGMSF